MGSGQGPLGIGRAVPQTAVIPVMTWHYMLQLLNFARIRRAWRMRLTETIWIQRADWDTCDRRPCRANRRPQVW
jgi:hypothetical protein